MAEARGFTAFVVIENCQPRESIIQGTFNPEVFTAALGPVIGFYHGKGNAIDSVYTDAEVFFREATFPTDGLKTTVSNIFRRIAGDMTAPSVQRMETAFGGGKTHTLISCVHLAYRGKELAGVTGDILDPKYLPADEFEHVPPTNLLFCLSKKTSPLRFKVEGIFIQLVAELLQRIADGMKERKADITIGMLMKRLAGN